MHLRQRVGAHGGSVVVDGGTQGAWLGGRGDVAVDVLGGEGARPGRLASQGPAQRLVVPGRHQPLGQPGELEGDHVPAAPQLPRAAQALEEADRMGRVEHYQPLNSLGGCMANSQASPPPQSCPTTAAEPASKATIRSATSWTSTLGW